MPSCSWSGSLANMFFFIAVSLHNNQNFAEQFEQVLELAKPPTGSLNITLLSKQGPEPCSPQSLAAAVLLCLLFTIKGLQGYLYFAGESQAVV